MPLFSRNPERLEAKALEYERKGNTRKAIKNREKAARIRSKQAGSTGYVSGPAVSTIPLSTGATSIGQPISTIPITSTTQTFGDYTPRTQSRYEQNALKWEQRGNWEKAQKNREKAWRLQNPQFANSMGAPSFYNNNRFLGYNVPFNGAQSGLPLNSGLQSGLPLNSGLQGQGFQRHSFFGSETRDPLIYESRAAEYERLGNQKKALRYRNKATGLRSNNGIYKSNRTQADYDRRALKWEQRGNWQKAQKNREKAWRFQNPQYMNTAWTAPQFYQQNRFVGYNTPFQSTQTNFSNPSHSYFTTVNSNFFNKSQGFQGLQGQGFQNQGYMQQGAPIVRTMTAAPTIETHLHNTIVQQTTRMEKVTEIQPVIHREIDAPQVRIVEQHSYESVPRAGPATITRNAIVEETVKPRIIEEIQPVVHREVPQTFVEKIEKHVTEHVVLPTTQSRQVVDQGRGFSGLSGQRFGLVQPGFSSFHQYSQFGRPTRDIGLYQQRLGEYERLGNQKKAQRYRQKIASLQANNGQYKSSRQFPDYERKALKWEQKGNLQKAQRNREKAWRLQNPQYMGLNQATPLFYNNGSNQFLGYNQTLPTGINQQLAQGSFLNKGLAGQQQVPFQAAGAPVQRF